jgi:FOG: EAL domain
MNTVIISGEEFSVSTAFQPVYSLSSQKIYKYESLGRLENIAGDGVAATDIAESAANRAVIRQVTEIIFNLTCSLLIRKNELRASFHFPKSLFGDEEFLAKMHGRCEILGIQPEQIEIELSEEIAAAQLIENLSFLLLARRYGFKNRAGCH